MSFTPPVAPQIDGSPFAQSNCVPKTGEMLSNRSSVSGNVVSGLTIRTESGDTSGGMTYSQAAAVLANHGINTQVLTTSRAGLKSIVVAGHGVGVSILCSVTINTPYHTGTYTGGHSIYVNAWRYNAGLSRDEYLVADPGRGTTANPLGYVWWPAWLLYKAAEARTPDGTIVCLVGRDTEGVTLTTTGSGTVYTFATMTSAPKSTFSVGKQFASSQSVNGGTWSVAGHTGKGWYQVAGGYIAGRRLG